jgi:uncharacterized protein (TIGR03083 family)
MTEFGSLVASTYEALAQLLSSAPPEVWDAPSLCEGWQVRHVVSHVTMPARLTPAQFGAELAAVGGDFGLLSNTLAVRDAFVPVAEHVAQLRSPTLHRWQPPGGGQVGALSHAVIHSLDITIALDVPTVAPSAAVVAVLDQLTGANGSLFGIDTAGVRLAATDLDWCWGTGETVAADSGRLVALLSGRALPDSRVLARV